jgi:hypothetical protein
MSIEPGTTLSISDGAQINIYEEAKILAVGNKDAFITLRQENNYWGGFRGNSTAQSIFKFVKIIGIGSSANTQQNIFQNDSNQLFEDIEFYDCSAYAFYSTNALDNSSWNRINIHQSYIATTIRDTRHFQTSGLQFRNINVVNVRNGGRHVYANYPPYDLSNNEQSINILVPSNNNYILEGGSGEGIVRGLKFYLGSAKEATINSHINDSYTNSGSGVLLERDQLQKYPYEGAHGMFGKSC